MIKDSKDSKSFQNSGHKMSENYNIKILPAFIENFSSKEQNENVFIISQMIKNHQINQVSEGGILY